MRIMILVLDQRSDRGTTRRETNILCEIVLEEGILREKVVS